MSDSEFGRLAVIGLGLIGGSVAAGSREKRIAEKVIGWDSHPETIDKGMALGVIDEGASSIKDATENSDLVVVAVPVLSMADVFREMSGRQLITDVGSVKHYVMEAARESFAGLPDTFVPGHPIAGSEKHGVTAAAPDLFLNHRVILTPAEETSASAIRRVTGLWEALGARVTTMTPQQHDVVLAQTSHLPHLLAYALVDTLSAGGSNLEVFEYAAGGFRDFSRIAASDPTMWRDIFRANPGPVVDILDSYMDELSELRRLIKAGDGQALQEVFRRANAARRHFSALDEKNRGG